MVKRGSDGFVGPSIDHRSKGEDCSLIVLHKVVQPEGTRKFDLLNIPKDRLINIQGHSDIMVQLVADKLTNLKPRGQLLEHFTKEPQVFEFLLKLQDLNPLKLCIAI